MSEIFGIYKKKSTGDEMPIDWDTWKLALATMAESEGKDGNISFDSREKGKELFKLVKTIQRGRNLLRNQQIYELTEDHSSSGHFAYSPEERQFIVKHYLKDKRDGEVANQESWAAYNFGISGRTLRRYLIEFNRKRVR